MNRFFLTAGMILLALTFTTGCFPDDYLDDKDDPETPVVKPEVKPEIKDTVPQTGFTGPLELNVVGRYLKDAEGNIVNLHGFGQTYSPFFNNFAWDNYDVEGCLRHNKSMIDQVLAAGWRMNFVRMQYRLLY